MATSDLYGFKYLNDYVRFPEWHTEKKPRTSETLYLLSHVPQAGTSASAGRNECVNFSEANGCSIGVMTDLSPLR